MDQDKTIGGFSKLSKKEKINWVARTFFPDNSDLEKDLSQFWLEDAEMQRVIDGFSENTLTNFFLPFGVAPNFLINNRIYAIPMVTEESSVVAAVSKAAKFWLHRGGFTSEVISTRKVGQLHFSWNGNFQQLQSLLPVLKKEFLKDAAAITRNMEKRGGGIREIELLDFSAQEPDYYQFRINFETCDSMGANFINSVLESFGQTLTQFIASYPGFHASQRAVTIIMAILSNYTPECMVRSEVHCPIEKLGSPEGMTAQVFAEKFRAAVRIAEIDPYRATTHNKGIFNGIDAVVLATGNDFRAVEAGGHTYAARDGQYRSLSHCVIENGMFRFWLEIPLAVGTVGGLTHLHPLSKKSLELLGNPSATTLMEIIAATGLAQNFAALRSLVTTGIQKGHMKMHLLNILNHLKASVEEEKAAKAFFQDKVVSFSAVRTFLENSRVQKSKPVN